MARVGLAAATVNGKIYAIGGSNSILNNNSVLNTVEVYDPSSDSWGAAANMSTTRSYFAAAALQGKIYAIGGMGTANSLLNTVEVYDASSNSWTAEYNLPRRGGIWLPLLSMGRFTPLVVSTATLALRTRWKSTIPLALLRAPFHGPRSPACQPRRAGLAVIPVDGKIYAIGGRRNNSAAVNLWKSMIPVPIHGAQLPTSLRCGNLRLRAMLTVWFTPWVGMMVGLVRIPSGHRSNGTPPR
ncbi:MAG: hypothetical protein AUH15_04120 [Acidobacteriales bacterium 13_2_20CM_55_8]|nr:MAG: hypothetical protein AUH15_04120 [Acidobacteriales bacterium 13_2_20CM_55_8]